MTSWEEVFRRGREVAGILQSRGRPTARYDNYPTPIDGWVLCQFGGISFDPEYNGRFGFKEVWVTDNILILSKDGTIYQYMLTNTERGTRESNGFRVITTRNPLASPIRPQTLHPTSYQEVQSDDVMESLNRLAIKENSDPEPAAPGVSTTSTFSQDPPRPTPPVQPRPTPRTNGPAQVTWGQPKKDEEGSEWTPILLTALGVIVFVAIVALVVFLTNDLQYH